MTKLYKNIYKLCSKKSTLHYGLNFSTILLYHYVLPTCSLTGLRADLVHCLIGRRLVRYITLAWLSLDFSTLLEWHKLSGLLQVLQAMYDPNSWSTTMYDSYLFFLGKEMNFCRGILRHARSILKWYAAHFKSGGSLLTSLFFLGWWCQRILHVCTQAIWYRCYKWQKRKCLKCYSSKMITSEAWRKAM